MRKVVSRVVLGGAALLTISQLVPPSALGMAALGLAVMAWVVLRRRRQMALAVI